MNTPRASATITEPKIRRLLQLTSKTKENANFFKHASHLIIHIGESEISITNLTIVIF